eukprot:scaffold270239_cov17-Tisochrysis_lutea.AAC.1
MTALPEIQVGEALQATAPVGMGWPGWDPGTSATSWLPNIQLNPNSFACSTARPPNMDFWKQGFNWYRKACQASGQGSRWVGRRAAKGVNFTKTLET